MVGTATFAEERITELSWAVGATLDSRCGQWRSNSPRRCGKILHNVQDLFVVWRTAPAATLAQTGTQRCLVQGRNSTQEQAAVTPKRPQISVLGICNSQSVANSTTTRNSSPKMALTTFPAIDFTTANFVECSRIAEVARVPSRPSKTPVGWLSGFRQWQ